MAEVGALVTCPGGPAIPDPGRDRARADLVAPRRSDAEPDRPGQPQSAAAIVARAWRCSASAAPTPQSRRCSPMRRSSSPSRCWRFLLEPVRGAGAGWIVGDRLSDDRRPARLARRSPAALGRRLGPLADRRRQGRDLRRAVHRLHPDRRPCAHHPGRGLVSERLRARRRAGAGRRPVSARHDRRRQRRRHSALLRSASGGLPEPAGAWRGIVAGLGLSLAYVVNLAAYDGGTRFLAAAAIGALSFAGVDLAFDAFKVAAASGRSCRAGVSMPSARPWARWSRARSAGISTRPRSRWCSPSSGPTPTSITARAGGNSATSPPIRFSTNTVRSISARWPAASGCSGRSRSPASSTGRSRRRCSRSITCCSTRCFSGA